MQRSHCSKSCACLIILRTMVSRHSVSSNMFFARLNSTWSKLEITWYGPHEEICPSFFIYAFCPWLAVGYGCFYFDVVKINYVNKWTITKSVITWKISNIGSLKWKKNSNLTFQIRPIVSKKLYLRVEKKTIYKYYNN